MSGDGGTASTDSGTSLTVFNFGIMSDAANTANTFGSVELTIPNYAGSTDKAITSDSVSENNATTAYQLMGTGLFANTAAITSLYVQPNSGGSFVAGSSFTLYGIA